MKKNVNKAVKRHLREEYEKVCNAYVLELMNMYGLDGKNGYWIGNDVGGTFAYGDLYYFGFIEIRYIVENNVSLQTYSEWMDYCAELGSLGVKRIPELRDWCNHCPRWSDEEIERLRDAKRRSDEARNSFEKVLDEFNEKQVIDGINGF